MRHASPGARLIQSTPVHYVTAIFSHLSGSRIQA